MRTKRIVYTLLCSSIALFNNCGKTGRNTAASLSIDEVRSPAGPGSGEPSLFTAADGRVYLSWLEPISDNRHALRFAVHDGTGWSQPQTIAQNDNWFVNWADFPSLLVLPDGWLAAHWLARSGKGTYAYNVNIAQSTDGGKTWGRAIVPHRDDTETEHGFVSMLPWFDGRLSVVWLDGRNFAKAANDHRHPTREMTLRFATMDRAGQLSDETVLDSRVCECCQTSATRTANGAIVAYRSRSRTEMRDISIVRWENGRWSPPRTLHHDNWQIHGCPVNGPSVAANGDLVAIAWFTAANDSPKVKVVFSTDAGATFGEPILLNDGETLGRVRAILLSDGAALVSWMVSTKTGGEIRVCRVWPDGSRDLVTTLAHVSTGRASGFPQMTRSGQQIYFAWTQVGEPSAIRTAVGKLSDD